MTVSPRPPKKPPPKPQKPKGWGKGGNKPPHRGGKK